MKGNRRDKLLHIILNAIKSHLKSLNLGHPQSPVTSGKQAMLHVVRSAYGWSKSCMTVWRGTWHQFPYCSLPTEKEKHKKMSLKTFLSWPVACVFFGTDSCHPFPCQLSLRAVSASLAFLSPRCLCLMLENPNSSSYLKSFVYQLELIKVKGRS